MTQQYTMKITRLILFAVICTFIQTVDAQKIKVQPVWEQPAKLVRGNDTSVLAPSFVNAQYSGLPESILPAFNKRFAVPKGTTSVSISIDSLIFIPFTSDELVTLTGVEIPVQPEAEVSLMTENGNPYAVVTVNPFGKDPITGNQSKLASFDLNIITSVADSGDSIRPPRYYAANSRLVYGDWFKLWVRQTGIHKITYEDMRNMGMHVDGINPDFFSMFGRGGAIMSESAGSGKYDDLTEISIRVVTATPGSFKPGDYVLFYAEGPVTWKYNPLSGRIDHATHLYTDVIGYFITVANYSGKRIPQADLVTAQSNAQTNNYTAVAVYEKEDFSLIKSGRKWFSHKFDNYTRSITLPEFNFPDIDLNVPVSMGFGVAGRSTEQMSISIEVSDQIVNTTNIAKYSSINDYARELTTTQSFNATSGNFKVTARFNPPNSSALGWLDFISFNVRSKLKFRGSQMNFRDPQTLGADNITSFVLEADQQNVEIWDVTNHSYVHRIPTSQTGNNINFKVNTSRLREFIAFDGTTFFTPEFAGKVPNQDLHAIGNHDMIIVTHPSLRSQATRLAKLHNNLGELSVKVVSLPDIYNEFSSGHQDITAIRDFMKMLYDRSSAEGYPRYLLLFGNASYDVKDRIFNNNNLVPTYQGYNSVAPTSSFLTDDYFGMLDDGEGGGINVSGLIDVAVGRLPVRTLEQATDVVTKIEAYLTNSPATHGEWRNNIMVIGDDEDNNAHFNQAERLCDIIAEDHSIFNVNKVHFDAFRQNSTPGGGRYPDVNRELNSQVDKGVLITNYIGHGGELGWADERVLEISDITAWKNFDRMGLFFTATCEFSRFDNPQHTSAGELVFLNPVGGAVAMITTTRLAYASTNENLNESFIDTVLNKTGGIPRMGDIIKYTKNDNFASPNVRHLTLFGDPALPMALPKYNVVTTAMVDPNTLMATDTLSANGKITLHGEVQDQNNNTLNSFNGEVYVKVFDKESTVKTLGQDAKSFPVNFKVQKNVIYQGKAKVENGLFNITFPVPLDIDYNFGKGKISYYATDGVDDANGYYTNFVIGGSKSINGVDDLGPDITLYINDTTFIEGDLTSENPKLLVRLFDESGINTLGNGVGHDLVAVLDENNYNSVLLNDFYSADLDSYQSGWAKYHFFNLTDGPHSITVKAWDVFNNSSTATVNFVVKRDIRLDIDDVIAYPNPSKGKVWFRFKHNLFDALLNLEIEIYNSTGTLVRVLSPGKVTASGYMVDEIAWDGLSTDGSVLRNGLYVCRVKVLDRNGYSSAHTVKVIMAK